MAIIDPLRKRATTIYDAAGRTTASVNALNQRSTTVYNAANHAIASINAVAIRSTQVYVAWGNSIFSTGTTVNPFRWVGQFGYYQDASTGVVYVQDEDIWHDISEVDECGFAGRARSEIAKYLL